MKRAGRIAWGGFHPNQTAPARRNSRAIRSPVAADGTDCVKTLNFNAEAQRESERNAEERVDVPLRHSQIPLRLRVQLDFSHRLGRTRALLKRGTRNAERGK